MSVLLLQMAHAEGVEDLGDLDGTLLDSMLLEASGWIRHCHLMPARAPRRPCADCCWRRPRANPCADG
jgi:hypothetical protein